MGKQLILLSVLLVLGQPGLAENDGHSGSHDEDEKFTLNKWKCTIPLYRRRDCGYPGISQEECSRRKCCFDSSISGEKWCFFSRSQRDLEKSAKEIEGANETLQELPTEDLLQVAGMNKWKCDINPNRRRDCGYPGISKIRCSLRKCCFDPGKTGANRCYFSKVLAQSGFAETLEESAKEIKAGEQPLQAGPIEDVLQVAGKANLKCAISPFWRRECGYPGIKQRECSNRKCCFDAGKTGSKRCYFSREHAQPGLTGTLEESAKEIEGGKESPQAPPIEDVGQVSGCSISHKLRKDCGYPNISSEDCHSKGCCYDPSVAGTVRCFYKDK